MRKVGSLKRRYVYGSLIILGLLAGAFIITLKIRSHPITQVPAERVQREEKPDVAETGPKGDQPATKAESGSQANREIQKQSSYVLPTPGFINRVTKKPFGIYVEPGNSPVSPERFTGYHTGVDAEYGDIEGDIPVRAIAGGTVIAAQYVEGYGGAVAVKSRIEGQMRVVIYGHLDPDRLPEVGTQLAKGEQFAYLGRGYTRETDGERRHLHLGITRDAELDWRGYVQNKSALSGWLNPLKILK